jgi:hypothetical protein
MIGMGWLGVCGSSSAFGQDQRLDYASRNWRFWALRYHGLNFWNIHAENLSVAKEAEL